MAYLDEKAFNVEVGKSYEIEAYFVGYAASHDYVAMMMTSLSEVGGRQFTYISNFTIL